MTANIKIVNYTRYRTEDIRNLAQIIADCNETTYGTTINLVVDTYKTRNNGEEKHWVNLDAASSNEIRIVAPQDLPIPLAEKISVLGRERPTLPSDGKRQVVNALLTAIRPKTYDGGMAWRTPGLSVYYKKRLDDVADSHTAHDFWAFRRSVLHPLVEKSGIEIGINEKALTKKPKVSPKRYDWAKKRIASAKQDLWAMAYFSRHRMGNLEDDIAKALEHLDKIAADQRPTLEEWLEKLKAAEEEHRLLLLQLKRELNDLDTKLDGAKALAIGGKDGTDGTD